MEKIKNCETTWNFKNIKIKRNIIGFGLILLVQIDNKVLKNPFIVKTEVLQSQLSDREANKKIQTVTDEKVVLLNANSRITLRN